MHSTDLTRRYIEAWNSRSPAAIAGMFEAGGTYIDPASNGPLSGAAIAAFADALFAAFPDLSFEIVSNAEAGPSVVLEWIMNGTNTGSLRGLPPTGKRIAVPGIDVIRLRGDRIERLQGYFDRQTMLEQLGLQVVVQPQQVGPINFGVSTRVRSGNTATPGAFSLTMLDARDEAAVQEVRLHSRRVMLAMPAMPGFLSFLGIVVARRLYTVSAWTDPEKAHAVMLDGAHKEATAAFFKSNLATAFHSSIWAPVRMGPRWQRCASCARMMAADNGSERCQCGAALPEAQPFW
jgi:steroid delta-isomerase-like uncharacterized protein